MKLRTRTQPVADLSEVAAENNQFVGAPEPVRTRNVAGMAFSALLITLGTLLFVYLFGGTDQSDPIVSMQRAVAQGDIISEGDLVQVDLAVSAQSNIIRWADRGTLIGKEASAPLPAGALPHTASVRDTIEIPDGFAELGLVVPLGNLPSQKIRSGDLVDIVINTRDAGDKQATLGASNIEVLSVSKGEELAYLTLLLPNENVVDVSSAVSLDEFRLVRADG